MCSHWPQATDNQKGMILDEINNYVIKPTLGESFLLDPNVTQDESGNYHGNFNDLEALFKKIYKQIPSANHDRTFTCAWGGTPGLIAQRIDSDLSRNYCIF